MNNSNFSSSDYAWASNCKGPQNGETLCPCRMKDIIIRNGRYIQKERDLGPVRNSEYDLTEIFNNIEKHNKNDSN